jgi:hypothetical protein
VWIDRKPHRSNGAEVQLEQLDPSGRRGSRTANCTDWIISNNDIGPIVPGIGPSAACGFRALDRVWIVGNRFYYPGPITDEAMNNDCVTLQGVQDYVVDGNTCEGGADGIDVGMHGDQNHPLFRGIIRANFVRGQGFGKNFKHSCQAETPITPCGQTSFYKNVDTFDASGHFEAELRGDREQPRRHTRQNTFMAGTASNNSATGG